MLIGSNLSRWSNPGRYSCGAVAASVQFPSSGGRFGIFTVFPKTTSVPNGYGTNCPTPPYTAGGMAARSVCRFTLSADLLNGGPMSASFAPAFTPGNPSMGLIVKMSAGFAGAMTMVNPKLSMTVGMTAAWVATITCQGNMSMVVPLGSTTFACGATGSADLHGFLSMSASFGGAEPLSPQGLANAVWSAASSSFTEQGTMGRKLNDAGGGSSPTDIADAVWAKVLP